MLIKHITMVLWLNALVMAGFNASASTEIEFTGSLIEPGCKVATDSEKQEVQFPELSPAYFKINNRSAPQTFSISLTDCQPETEAAVFLTFSNLVLPAFPELFSVTGEASGIAIALETSTNDIIKNGERFSVGLITEEEPEFSFNAYVQRLTVTDVTPGDFISVINFLVEYE